MRTPAHPAADALTFRRRIYRPLLALALLCGSGTLRAQLTWGINGGGGAGNWDSTTANWYNGTSNVPWNSTTATFAGTAGAISAVPFLTVQGMTFNVAGYSINNGFFEAPDNLTVTTNAAATIDSTADSKTLGGTFIKNGTDVLTYSGTNFFSNVQLNAGEYVATTENGAFFSDFNLANAAGVTLTLGGTGSTSSSSFQGLNGGGTAGGVVRPGTQGGTLTVSNFGGGTFAGVVQDNGSTKLAFTQFSTGATQALTGANTYTGATAVAVGNLTFSGNGTALNTSAVSVSSGAVLTLDDSGTALGNRLAGAAPVSLTGGEISFNGNASTAVTEALGALQYSSASTLNATQPGTAAALLSFSGITRGAGATLNVTGSGGVTWTGIANGSNGIIGAYVTDGNEWAVAGANGNVQPLANYATNPATAGPSANVKITAASTALPASGTATWSTLNLQNANTSTQTLDLGAGSTLVLQGGGLLSSGSGPGVVTDGTLAASGELVVTNQNALTIASAIAGNTTTLTKSGQGTLVLTGANTYPGTTYLTQGVLAVSADANLGAGTTISFNGGTLQANGSFTTAKNLANNTGEAIINTNGYNVTVTGTNTAVQQTGAGILTLTTAVTGSTFTSSSGTLALPNATSGYSTIEGGTLQAAGTLSQLSVYASGTLDIGGSGAQKLTLNGLGLGLMTGDGQVLTVLFTLGSTAQDQLAIEQSTASLSSQSVLFTINRLGSIQTGVNYTLISLPNGAPDYTAAAFGLSPASTAAGYRGTFTVGANAVTIDFQAVPEPSTTVLVAGLMILGAAAAGRRR